MNRNICKAFCGLGMVIIGAGGLGYIIGQETTLKKAEKEIKQLTTRLCPYSTMPWHNQSEKEVINGLKGTGICDHGIIIAGADIDGDVVYRN